MEGFIWKFTTADSGVGEKGSNAALNVNPRICFGCSGCSGKCVEFFLAAYQVLRHVFEQQCPLMKSHAAECRAACVTGMIEHRLKIQSPACDLPEQLSGDGVLHNLSRSFAFHPFF